MSDRIAVFDKGKIQQVDRPSVIYERPSSVFVADFVGVSNLISGEAASKILGRNGTFTVRPEKIQIGESNSNSDRRAEGVIREVEYLGPSTRFLVHLDQGVELVALKQNTSETSIDVEGLRNKRVVLSWDKNSEFEVRT